MSLRSYQQCSIWKQSWPCPPFNVQSKLSLEEAWVEKLVRKIHYTLKRECFHLFLWRGMTYTLTVSKSEHASKWSISESCPQRIGSADVVIQHSVFKMHRVKTYVNNFYFFVFWLNEKLLMWLFTYQMPFVGSCSVLNVLSVLVNTDILGFSKKPHYFLLESIVINFSWWWCWWFIFLSSNGRNEGEKRIKTELKVKLFSTKSCVEAGVHKELLMLVVPTVFLWAALS